MLKALNRLSEEGIVKREDAGNAILFSLNRSHLAAAPVERLVNLREELLDRLTHEFAAWTVQSVHASLFGSAARGDGSAESDIDIFVVRPARVKAEDPVWRGQVERLATHLEDWTGNRASIADVSEADLPELSRRRPAIVPDLEADALRLAGPDVTTLLRGEL
ncbi:MAG TPA: nucleotidyltransferase domain-containing protein [Solirubrobacterales bacterium]